MSHGSGGSHGLLISHRKHGNHRNEKVTQILKIFIITRISRKIYVTKDFARQPEEGCQNMEMFGNKNERI